MRARASVHRGEHASEEATIFPSQAVLQAFDSGTYTATITLLRSPDQAISGVPVSRGIAASAMVAGSVVAVIFYSRFNSADGMVVGVH